MRSDFVVESPVLVKDLLCMVKIPNLVILQAFFGKGTIESFFLALGLWVPDPSMKGEDAQFHEPHFKPGIPQALGCPPGIPIVSKKAEWNPVLPE